jgi:transposase-like protein
MRQMPWKESRVLDQHVQFIAELLKGEESMTALCENSEISRKTRYKWQTRYREGGAAALESMSRRPHYHPAPHRREFVRQAHLRGLNASSINAAPLRMIYTGIKHPRATSISVVSESDAAARKSPVGPFQVPLGAGRPLRSGTIRPRPRTAHLLSKSTARAAGHPLGP